MRRSTLPGACLHAARLGALRSVAGAAIAPRRRSACAGLRGARLGGIITAVGGLGPRPVSHGEFWHAHAGRSACDAGLRRHHRMIGGGSSDRALGSGPRVDDWRARRCESSQRQAWMSMSIRASGVVASTLLRCVERECSAVCKVYPNEESRIGHPKHALQRRENAVAPGVRRTRQAELGRDAHPRR